MKTKKNKMDNIAIIIPTYNELDNIEKLVKEIKKNIKKCNIIIVDDSKKNDIGKLIINKKFDIYFLKNKIKRFFKVLKISNFGIFE